MDIDRQRIAAVRALEAIGYRYHAGEWLSPGAPPLPPTTEADAMHGMLMLRADALADCAAGSEEEIELQAIVDLIEAYEAKRWPLGKGPNVPGG
jgi:hypothetical protein